MQQHRLFFDGFFDVVLDGLDSTMGEANASA